MEHMGESRIWEAVKYISLEAAGIILFKFASAYLAAKRGCDAVGGEYFLLLLPAIYAAAKDMAQGLDREIREIFAEQPEDEQEGGMPDEEQG